MAGLGDKRGIHVTDIEETGRYGVVGTLALRIDGKPKSLGSVPPRNKLIEWLEEVKKHY